MEKKQVKVGYWTYEEFCKKFPDFDKIPVCDNYRPGRVAKFTNVKFASSILFAILRKTILNLKHSANSIKWRISHILRENAPILCYSLCNLHGKKSYSYHVNAF